MRFSRLGVAGICALTLILPGCGSGADSSSGEAAGSAATGAPLTLADCADWNQAGKAVRLDTITYLAKFAGGQVGNRPGGHGSVLSDQRAYALLDSDCRPSFARGFKLYKLYTRAAAFQTLAP